MEPESREPIVISPSNPSFTPFYVTGGTLRGDAASYVQRQADESLFAGLLAGEFCYVLDARQMGKSSLMIRTAARLEAEGITVIKLDLTTVGLDLSSEQWYFGLLEGLGCRLEAELEAFWEAHRQLGPLKRWFKAIEEVLLPRTDGRLVIFVDEIDIVRSLPFRTDEFFAGIRACYNRRASNADMQRLSFCLLGVTTPSELIEDVAMTPFNIGTRIELNDFTPREAALLGQGLSGSGRDGAELLDRVLYWTGGHPYLTQQLCRSVAELEDVRSPDDVDRLVGDLFLSARARKQDNNLLFVSSRLLQSGADVATLLELYGRVYANKRIADDETDPRIGDLRLSGIVRVASGCLRVRNRIYFLVFDLDWVRASMPDAEVRRQRVAYRRGLFRALALSSAVLAVVIAFAVYGFTQARLARINAGRADENSRKNGELAGNLTIALKIAVEQKNLADRKTSEARQNLGLASRRLTEVNRARIAEARAEINALNQATLARKNADLANRRADDARTAKIAADAERDSALHLYYITDMNLIPAAYETNNFVYVRRLLEEMRQEKYRNFRGFEWGYWNRLCHMDLMTLTGHTGHVTSAAFSTDGRRIVTGSSDRTAKVWDADSGRVMLTLKGHTLNVNSVAFSADGRRIVTGSEDKSAKVWDAGTGRVMLTIKGHAGGLESAAFSPDGRYIVTGSRDNTAKVWDTDTGRVVLTLKGHTGVVTSAAFSPDGRRIVTGSSDRTAKVWDADTGRVVLVLLTLKGHADAVRSAAFSPDGRRIVTASDDNTAKVWDANTDRETLTLKGHLVNRCVEISPDGRRIVTGNSDRTATVWDAGTGRETLTLKGHTGVVNSAAFSPDGRRIVTGSSDRTAKVWDAITGLEAMTLNGHVGEVTSVAFSPDGRRIITGSRDNTAKVWDAGTGRETLALKGHSGPVASVAFSPDGQRIVTGSYDNTAMVWDAGTGRETVTLKGRTTTIRCVAFSPDARRIVTGSADNTAKVWDAGTGQEVLTLSGHTRIVTSAAFSPDGRRIVTGSADNTAKVWDAGTGREVLTLKGHTGVVDCAVFTRDGQCIKTASADNTAKLWISDGGGGAK